MSGHRHLTWETFQQSFLAPGHRARHIVSRSPLVEIFVDEDSRRIGVRSPVADVAASDGAEFQDIDVEVVVREGTPMLEVSTRAQGFFRVFYSVMIEFADLIQFEKLQPNLALARAVQSFRHLLRAAAGLSVEEQVGLFGELWVLAKLIEKIGIRAMDTWLAPKDQPHDFRFGNLELEIKTTTHARRVHVIHGESQLEPSVNRKLYVLSLQLAVVGTPDGISLDELAAFVALPLANDPAQSEYLKTGLGKRRYMASDRYPERYVLRSEPRLVAVDAACPRLTGPGIIGLLGIDKAARISDVRYRVNLEGLGVPEGAPEYNAIIGKAG